MKIVAVTSDFYQSIVSLFRGVGQTSVLKSTKEPLECDLLVFTGGEDINPQMYKNSGDLHADSFYNDFRDNWEKETFSAVVNGIIRPKKILGICRGHQFLTIAHGGVLFYDLHETFGQGHKAVHPLTFEYSNHPLNFLQKVNSMHHQGINSLRGGTMKFPSTRHYNIMGGVILAVEPVTNCPEIVVWGDSALGVQFHPEFFGDGVLEKEKFAETIKKWILGEVCMNPTFVKATKQEIRGKSPNRPPRVVDGSMGRIVYGTDVHTSTTEGITTSSESELSDALVRYLSSR